MKRAILIAGLVCASALQLSGCGPMTYEQRQVLGQSLQQMGQDYQNQRLFNAQLDYYSRPYKQGNVTIVPRRR